MDSLEYEFQDIAGRLGFEPVLAIDRQERRFLRNEAAQRSKRPRLLDIQEA
jgi:hypothetical protein